MGFEHEHCPGSGWLYRPAAAVTKTFPKPKEELEASRIQFAVATRAAVVFCASPWGLRGVYSPTAPMRGSESPVVHRLMVSFKNPGDPLAYAIVVERAMQGCLSAFSPVVIQYQGFSRISL